MQRIFDTLAFDFVCQISPQQQHGSIIVDPPHLRYTKQGAKPLNEFGNKSFCRFRIPDELHQAGVYILTVDGVPYYVGECIHLSKRYNIGYGQISPRNCYVGGQVTNCRINHLICQSVLEGKRIDLWFYETADRFDVESYLIRTLGTQKHWNRKK